MLQVVFRLRRPRVGTRVTALHPGVRLLLWCNLKNDVIEIQGASAEMAAAIAAEYAREHGPVRPLHDDGGAPRRLVFRCPHRDEESVSRLVELHGSLLVPPIVCEQGWDRFRVFCYDEAQMPAFFRALRALGEFEILSKSPLGAPVVEEQFLVSAADLLGSLTAKQSEALLQAMEAGYYDVPRRATLQEIAQRLGRPRTTMEEHLRKAEGKVLLAMAPMVAMRAPPPVAAKAASAARTPRRKQPGTGRQRAA